MPDHRERALHVQDHGLQSSCLYSGRANVRKISRYTFRVTTMRVSKDCI